MSKAKILKNESIEDKEYRKLIKIGKEGIARNKKERKMVKGCRVKYSRK